MRCLIFFLLISNGFWSQSWMTCSAVPSYGRDDAAAFSMGDRGYIVTGNQGGFSESNRLWEYNPVTDEWLEKSTFPGIPRQYAGSFVLLNEAYVIGGYSAGGSPLNEVWKYNRTADSWIQLSDFPGAPRWSMFSFSLFDFGFIGTGSTLTQLLDDVWKYDPQTDSWVELATFPGGARRETVSFSALGKGYVGLGWKNPDGTNVQADFYRFDFLSGSWTTVADFPGGGRSYAVGMATTEFGYVGTGKSEQGVFYADCFRLDPVTETWTAIVGLPVASGIKGMSAFEIGKQAYLATGIDGNAIRRSDMWKLTEETTAEIIAPIVFPNPSAGGVVIAKAPAQTLITFFTLDARMVREVIVPENNTLLINNLTPGAYSVRFQSGKTVVHQLLVVND